MEAKLYRALYKLVRSTPHAPRRPREQFADWRVVLIYLWSVLHDRRASWACQAQSWRGIEWDGPLISQSQLSRRLRTVGVLQLVERLHSAASDLLERHRAEAQTQTQPATPAATQAATQVVQPPLVKQIDSKPLTVGAYSKDRAARRGRLADGQFAKGYRLHAITHGRHVRHWTLLPLNEHDSVAAPLLMPRLEGAGYVAADNAYDTNDCHALATAANHQLVAPARESNRGVRDVKHNRAERLRALDMLDSPLQACGVTPAFGQELYNCRQRIESGFGGLTFAGLGALPPWVRGPRRVALWCAGKILLHLCATAIKKGLMA
jgi:hypothetical protein